MKLKMKLILALAALVLILPLSPALAEGGCKIKEAEIEKQLAIARDAGNAGQIAGLEEALEQTRRHCDDARLETKIDMKVQEKELKVKQRELDLEEAKAKGDKDKIAEREEKLRKAQAELEEAKAKRDALQ
ncbi:DUF1090 domain-containing protein [Deltaproteobacteria bacterium Smac51]|nr:DUF1090 domain-containing protein [Deltaproteobacteria bacterium Smac51]